MSASKHSNRAVVGSLLLLLASFGVVSAFAQQARTKSVRVVIDYGDGVEKHFTALKWSPGMTVLEAMKRAEASPHGITFEYRGTGESAFLFKIDDLENQGGGSSAKNWMFRVNDKLATKSLGIIDMNPGDEVRWKFRTFKP